jgi:hypothetical protein
MKLSGAEETHFLHSAFALIPASAFWGSSVASMFETHRFCENFLENLYFFIWSLLSLADDG